MIRKSRRGFILGVPALLSLPWSLQSLAHASDHEKIKELLASKDRYRWLFTGDSITMGAKHTHGYRSYSEIFHERLQWELGRSWDIVINTGMSGHTTQHILEDFDWRVAQFNPSVISLMMGTNDAAKDRISPTDFKINLQSLITKFRDLGAIPILHTPNPIIVEKAPERKNLPEYIPAIKSIAEEEQVILVDNYAHWQKNMQERSIKEIHREWLNDPLHPNGKGHQQIAREMFRTLDIYDPNAATCGGDYYEGEH
ncbi:MAG: SGNH/GDSL hydrolase family protein [Saprospiraceae bacterium]|nr:SGNH/GDSL hydrolase family protein [Saprospiraceae bacterium]